LREEQGDVIGPLIEKENRNNEECDKVSVASSVATG